MGVRTPAYFTLYGPGILTMGAIGVLHSFLGQVMYTPKDGFYLPITALRIALRGWFREGAKGILRGDGSPKFDFLHPDRNL